MFSRKAVLRAQTFLRLAKPKLNAFNVVSSQAATFLSLSKVNSSKQSQQNFIYLHSPFKFSFSSTPDKNILQKTCLEDLASVKDLLPPGSMEYFENQLKIYSNCPDVSFLSAQTITNIRDALSFLEPIYKDTLPPEKSIRYNHEIYVLGMLLGEEKKSSDILDKFFSVWIVYEMSKIDQQFWGKIEISNVFERADFEKLLEGATQAYEKEVQQGKNAFDDKVGLYLVRAFLAFDSQRYDESLHIFEEISPEFESVFENFAGIIFVQAYFYMAKIYFMKGNAEHGIKSCRKLIDVGESRMRPDLMTGFIFAENAKLLHQNQEYIVALYSAKKAHEYFLKSEEEGQRFLPTSFSFIGNLHYELSNYQDAVRNHQAVLSFFQKYGSENVGDFQTAYMNLAYTYFANNQISESFDHFAKFREELCKEYGPNSPEVIMALKNWGYKLLGQSSLLPKSLEYLQEAFELHKQIPQDIERELTLLLALGKIQFLLRKDSEAKKSIEACEVLMNQVPNIDTEDKVAIFYYQGMIAIRQKEWEKVVEKTKKAMQIPGIRQIDVANCQNNLSLAFYNLGDKQKAEESYLKALEMYASLLGKTHQLTQDRLKSVIEFLEENQLLEKAQRIEEEYRIN